jgi:hypothetical protein
VEATSENKQGDGELSLKNDASVTLLPAFATMDMCQWTEIKVTEIIHDAALTIPKGLYGAKIIIIMNNLFTIY